MSIFWYLLYYTTVFHSIVQVRFRSFVTSLELQPTGDEPLPHRHEDGKDLIQVLTPTDTDAAAWKFLFGCFIVERLLWGIKHAFHILWKEINHSANYTIGFPSTFGVFQNYYSHHQQFEPSPNIAMIGVCTTGIYFLGAPLATPLVRKFQRWQRLMRKIAYTCFCYNSSSVSVDIVKGLHVLEMEIWCSMSRW